MRASAKLLVVIPVLLALGGCGDEYYQTRYIPPSSDACFSLSARATWYGDRQVYELPADPPAIGTDHPRRDCLPPGQVLPGPTIAGLEYGTSHQEVGEVVAISGTSEPPLAALPPLKNAAIYGWEEAREQGAHEPIGLIPVGNSYLGPNPYRGQGTDTVAPVDMAKYRDDQRNWCDVDK
jgi:hypothetical protein